MPHLRNVLHLIALIAVLAVRCAAAQSPPPDDENGSNAAAGYLFALPMPASPAELDRYAQILLLSPEQISVLKSLWDKYIVDFNALIEQRQPDIVRLAKAAQRTTDAEGYTSEAVGLHRSFQSSQSLLMEQGAALDRRLFDELSAVLAENQLQGVTRVRGHRDRARGRTMPSEVPSASIDLSWIVEQFRLTEDDMARLDPVISEYEFGITPHVMEMRRDYFKRTAEYAGLLNAVLFDDNGQPRNLNAPEQADRQAEFASKTERLFDDAARHQAQIVSLNRQFAPVIAAALRPEYREQFLGIYRSAAYPDAYSDPVDPRPIYDGALALPDFDNDHRQAADMLWQAYVDAYNTTTGKMEMAFDQFQESVAQTMTSSGLPKYQKAKVDLQRERWGRTAQFVEQMRTLLTADQCKRLAPEFDRCETLVRQLESTGNLPPAR